VKSLVGWVKVKFELLLDVEFEEEFEVDPKLEEL
jgi:hypothetical protein